MCQHFIDGDWISQGINCYSSTDLQHWQFEARHAVLTASSSIDN